jgi:hypothetical protein
MFVMPCGGNRTLDRLLTMESLYQLSYDGDIDIRKIMSKLCAKTSNIYRITL